MVSVVVSRPLEKTVTSPNKRRWWTGEPEQAEVTTSLIAVRDDPLAPVVFRRYGRAGK